MSKVDALTCPNCGGSVDINDAENEIAQCPYCGSTLQLPERARPQPVVVEPVFIPRREMPMPLPEKRAGIWGGLFTLIIILVIVGGIVVSIAPSGTIFTRYFLWNQVVPMPPAENGARDLLAEVRVGEEEDLRLIRLDGATRQVRWTTDQTFSTNSGRSEPLPSGDFIYYSQDSNLLALKAADGKLAWQTALANGIGNSCKRCLRLVDEQLIVLSKDGTLQAVDARTGEKTWSFQLNTSPNELLLAGGKPAVVELDADNNRTLLVFDPQTGDTAQLGTDGCNSPQAASKGRSNLEDVYLSPDGGLAYFMYYSFGPNNLPCAMQVDLITGKKVWSASPAKDQTWPSAWFAAEVMVSEQGVFYYESNVLSMIDAATGQVHTLFKEPRYRQVTPLASQSGRVVVIAIPDYDSDQKVLWGIDTASGQKAWTYAMKAKSIIDPWRVRLTQAGLVVVQCLRDSEVSQWETLDISSGASRGLVQISTTKYNFLDDAWTDDMAYLTIDSTLHTISIQNGAAQYTWP
jgi:outer membrane protein assembly factor BamB